MIGKPDYIPEDFTSWWEARINNTDMGRAAYVAVRVSPLNNALCPGGQIQIEYGWFVQESHADRFVRLLNDELMSGGAN